MDPLSVAASVIAVLQVAGQVTTQCQKYIQLCRNAKSEPLQIVREVGGLHMILTTLKHLAEWEEPPTENGTRPPPYESQDRTLFPIMQKLCQLGEVLDSCREKLEKLEKDLAPPLKVISKPGSKREAILHTLTWPLKDGQIKKVLADINRFISVFSLALSADTTTSILEVREKTNAMYSMVQDLHADEILRWLSAPDTFADQSDALQRRLDNTGAWFMTGQPYNDWKLCPNSLIWLHGIPGCGKTILTSTVVDDVFRHCGSDKKYAVAYFYFKADDNSKTTRTGMLRALIRQLFEKGNRESQALKGLFSRSQQQPTADILLSTLKEMVLEFEETFFILDALDECEERSDVLDDLEQIYKWKTANLHILVTSRDEEEIKEFLEPLCMAHGSIPISAALVKDDIRAYVRERLRTDRGLKRFRDQPKAREEIENILTEKSDGMFQWVVCQLKTLEKCYSLPLARKALERLPKTLYGTYEQMLCRIEDEDAGVALRIFQWLLFSSRPMLIEELAELAIVDLEEDPPVDIERRFLEPQDIMRICSGLVTTMRETIDNDTNEPRTLVRLAHISIREYFLSDAIRKGNAKAARYYIETVSAHTFIVESSLAYMQLFHMPIPDLVQEYPLASYVARYWLQHYEKVPEHASRTHELVLDFFVREKISYRHWLQFFCTSVAPKSIHPDLVEFISDSPLNIAATFNLVWLVKLMLESDEVDTSGPILRQALRFAYFGHSPPRFNVETASFLLEHGADCEGDERFSHTLHAASFFGLDEFVEKQLDAGVDVNTRAGTYDTALQAAVIGRHLRIYFGDIGHKEWSNGRPVINDVVEGRDPTTVRLLLKRKANPNLFGGTYGCALQAACSNGDIRCVQLLLRNGANPNLHGGRVHSALSAACSAKDIRIVRLLLEHGVDVNSPEALATACRVGSVDIVRLLLEKGADANSPGKESGGPLQYASYNGNAELVKLLLDNGADPNSDDGSFGTALQANTLCAGSEEIIKLLLDRGADLNLVSGNFGTPLQAAANIGDFEIVKFLISNGADFNVEGGFFGTALRAALNNEHSEIVAFLLQQGADLKSPGGRYGGTLRETLASVPEDKAEVLIELRYILKSTGKVQSLFRLLKRNGASFSDFHNISVEELEPKENDPELIADFILQPVR